MRMPSKCVNFSSNVIIIIEYLLPDALFMNVFNFCLAELVFVVFVYVFFGSLLNGSELKNADVTLFYVA